jgi:natural product biosynthesis luciferase-like monooxygenase protein
VMWVCPTKKWKLLIEGAKFGDAHGFSAIWMPERHFHEFGGIYPNPSITGAAIATITKNIHIRSGSCVIPLHNPIRVAEEWAVVDNLSQGRVGLSFASGWVVNDFLAFAPEAYENRHQMLYNGIEQVKMLWEGKAITLSNPIGQDASVQIFPKPVQQQLPVWITAADNPETFRSAGKAGANLLTHLLGQTIEELKEKIKLYRLERKHAGHTGDGIVTLMIHTFIGKDGLLVKESVKAPFKNYLRNATGLIRGLAKSMGQDVNATTFSDEDMEALLDHAFNRYYDTAALFGTPGSCLDMVNKLSHAGVDELGCLVDFGMDIPATLNGLEQLNASPNYPFTVHAFCIKNDVGRRCIRQWFTVAHQTDGGWGAISGNFAATVAQPAGCSCAQYVWAYRNNGLVNYCQGNIG